MNKKSYYYLNEHTLEYEVDKPSERKKRNRRLIFFLGSLILTAIIYFITPDEYCDLGLIQAQIQQKSIENQIDTLALQLITLEQKLDSLYFSDSVYNTLLNREGLPQTMLAAGQGGTQYTLPLSIDYRHVLVGLVQKSQALLGKSKVKAYSLEALETALVENQKKQRHMPSIQPIATKDISYWGSGFMPSRFHPILKIFRKHEGVDIIADPGTPVHAPAQGLVIAVRRSLTFGNVITIDHGYGVNTLYAHLNAFNVQEGDSVYRGDTIGFVGNTGLSGGAHLHYEVHAHGRPENPMYFIHDRLSQTEFEKIIAQSQEE